ncbi:MAG TPA: hypothetical protein VJ385_06785 [Fibrobacteria bacterium]|nr:hypothetical protein [Fibrobacteria bacterium]
MSGPSSRLPGGLAALLAVQLAASAAQATATLPAAQERNAPLIMENADKFEGYRSRGEYVLSGKVRFRHGELRVETERAVWQKDRNIIFCESGMRITRNGSLLTADRGTYDKNLGQATAQGNVFMRDSSGEVAATGQSIVYLRFRHLATLTGNPEVRRFYAAKDSGLAAAGRDSAQAKPGAPKASPDASDGDGPDTLSIKGDVMTYDDSLQVAIADGNVRIHRDKLNITCKKAEYHDPSDSLYLLGDPQVVVDDNQVKGEIMRLGMHGEEIKSLLVKGSAQAHSTEPATDTSVARQSDIRGDSLFLAFKQKAIDSVQVFKNANGAYFDVDKPEFVNEMSGEYMVLRFNGKQVASANVLGGAKSTYYHFEKKLLKGKNDAQGDTIDFAFKNGKVDEVMVKGAAKGTYFGEKARKPGAGGSADSAGARPGTDSAGAGTPAAKPDAKAAAEAAPAKPAAEKPRVNIPWRKK